MADELNLAKNKVAKEIIADVVLSEEPEKVLKKWRNIFGFSQKKLANYLGITSSVISDYESGRRKSPGIKVIKKYVDGLLSLDIKRGGNVIKSFSHSFQTETLSKAIIDIAEFSLGMKIQEFCKVINAEIVTKDISSIDREIYGYTVIDSIKAISEVPFDQLIRIYGTTTQRALIFTKVSTGRTPMVAIKLTNLQPGLVVLHGVNQVDEVAEHIAKAENIPLALCRIETVEGMLEKLKSIK